MHSVEGEMVLRNGQYVSSGDVLLTVQVSHRARAARGMAMSLHACTELACMHGMPSCLLATTPL